MYYAMTGITFGKLEEVSNMSFFAVMNKTRSRELHGWFRPHWREGGDISVFDKCFSSHTLIIWEALHMNTGDGAFFSLQLNILISLKVMIFLKM